MLRNPSAVYGCGLREGETGVIDHAIGQQLVKDGIALCIDPPPPQPKPQPLLAIPDAPAIASEPEPEIKAKATKHAKAKPQTDKDY